ncbi:MAG: hypothetical protein JOZ77_12455 [Candidatus Eremiobacteraeota bacterium]|nr:hypothetical protein [Candidatus Eremiobacteraeota bacterium]
MTFHRLYLGIVAGAAVLSLSLAACSGQSANSTYVPTTSTNSAVALSGDQIKSTCGKRIHIVVAGIVDCKFSEQNYGGNFKVYNKTKGIILITPNHGTKDTVFTVVGLAIGRGSFLVKDHKGNELIIKVRVTL